MSSYLTELALRAAVNLNDRSLTSAKGQAESIKDFALKRLQGLVEGDSDSSEASGKDSGASAAIQFALKGLKLAYEAISKQIDVLHDQRLSFDKERQAGIATFVLPTNKEESNFSKEEKVIKNFIEIVFKNPSFSNYFGIHHAELMTDKNIKFYSVLPFYRLSDALPQPVASQKPLDRQRTAISLFLKSALPDAFADIEDSFQMDSKFIAFWESAFQRKNYLNNRRAPRFIMMCLSNLLWNLQHPIDPETGVPLGLGRCIEICRDVELFLNQLLNSESPAYLQAINNRENELTSFIRKLEIYIKTLRAAFADEQLHELNIDEITNSAHSALRIMDKCLFKLIYKRNNTLSNKEEPDDTAAETLADTVSYLNLLLSKDPELINTFQPYPSWIPSSAMLNRTPLTIVDALIIFCHLSWRERDQLLEKMMNLSTDSASEFARTLRKFDKKFIHPIKEAIKAELHATAFSPKHQEVSCLTARRLIPLITLLVKDYSVELDTLFTYKQAKRSQQNSNSGKLLSGKQQIQIINLSAQGGHGYYTWAISPFAAMSKEVALQIDRLPKRQFRMTQVTELIDGIRDLVEHYHSFLQNHSFQTFLLKCLNKVKEEYASLDHHIEKIDTYLAQDERMSRSLQAILRPMTRDLNNSLEAFSLAIANFERLVSAPDFTDQQRQLLASKLSAIDEQYRALFSEASGISSLLNTPATIPVKSKPVVIVKPAVESGEVVALRKLVQSCYNALSYQSKEGRKGLLLRELLTLIDGRPNFSEGQIKHIVLELTRIAASYRETWLFQASYGETRSARALMTAIKDPHLNKMIPVASIIFNQNNLDILDISDAQIIARFKKLREGNTWQESINKIKLLAFSNEAEKL